ncbi:uncharacterized protein VTP21DRAFT_5793 [Calcarisporiella thermophila]|uniref:uncharacterized protein n=1 Tax=Calcarisporiella thermophila TaxID=911321 RepID=UPI0037449147
MVEHFNSTYLMQDRHSVPPPSFYKIKPYQSRTLLNIYPSQIPPSTVSSSTPSTQITAISEAVENTIPVAPPAKESENNFTQTSLTNTATTEALDIPVISPNISVASTSHASKPAAIDGEGFTVPAKYSTMSRSTTSMQAVPGAAASDGTSAVIPPQQTMLTYPDVAYMMLADVYRNIPSASSASADRSINQRRIALPMLSMEPSIPTTSINTSSVSSQPQLPSVQMFEPALPPATQTHSNISTFAASSIIDGHTLPSSSSPLPPPPAIAPVSSAYRIAEDYSKQRRDSSCSSETDNEQLQKQWTFISLPGINIRKRPRRKFEEIERNYACNWPGCTKAYGTLNHLNAHIHMQGHGEKRHPSEFKEMRKLWRERKKMK